MTEQTLRTAMAEYGDTVYRLALCRTQSIPDAEDVYQDVFLALLRQHAAFLVFSVNFVHKNTSRNNVC